MKFKAMSKAIARQNADRENRHRGLHLVQDDAIDHELNVDRGWRARAHAL